ncbi:methyltransferase domain-containing protein, partial [Patescibacteria group bacterium]|nr:methyltransferase domain-containing protein [Patescibacteria group bacterium]
MQQNIDKILRRAYAYLEPFSKRFSVDYKRYRYTLKLASSIGDLKSKKILDIGCGIGITSLAFQKLGATVLGLDKYIFSDKDSPLFVLNKIEQLKQKWLETGLAVKEKDLFEIDAQKYNNFDLIIAEAIIEHQTDPKKFLQKIHELLRPGGIAIISTPNLSTLLKRLRFLLGRSPHWDLKQFYELGDRFTGHWREYTADELKQMGKWAGFEII